MLTPTALAAIEKASIDAAASIELPDRTDICSALRYYRERAGLTRDQSGAHIGRSNQTIRAWEIGDRTPPLMFVARLARLYKVDCAELLGAAVPGNAEKHSR
jgi:transcriptional regulator with XRE-family HTH domain